MDVPILSTSLAQISAKNAFSVVMLGKSLDVAQESGAALIEMMDRSMELSVNPELGANIDVVL